MNDWRSVTGGVEVRRTGELAKVIGGDSQGAAPSIFSHAYRNTHMLLLAKLLDMAPDYVAAAVSESLLAAVESRLRQGREAFMKIPSSIEKTAHRIMF